MKLPFNPNGDYRIRAYGSVFSGEMVEVLSISVRTGNMTIKLIDKEHSYASHVTEGQQIWKQERFRPATIEEIQEMFKEELIFSSIINDEYTLI